MRKSSALFPIAGDRALLLWILWGLGSHPAEDASVLRLVLLQRNGLLVSIQHLLGEMLCRVAGGGGQSVLAQLPTQGGVR